MRDPIRPKDVQFPERILNKLLNDYVEGRLGNSPPIKKASVLQIDNAGAVLSGPGTDRPNEPPNPKGSLIARVITDSIDRYTPISQLTVFWPIFTHDLPPIKEGEHIYVIFEDLEQTHGLWLGRVPEPNDVHNLNLTPGTKRYTSDSENNLEESTSAAEKAVQDSEEKPEVVQPSSQFVTEVDSVPEFNARVGDRVIKGSNNTTIILSRDRVDSIDSGETEGAGAIDIVVGRTSEDVNMKDDAARIYVSMKSDADSNFKTLGDNLGKGSYAIAKADHVRLIAREGLKIMVEAGETFIVIDSSGNVKIKAKSAVEVDAGKDIKVKSGGNISLDANQINLNGELDYLVKSDGLKTLLLNVCASILAASPVDVAGIPGIGIINTSVMSAVQSAINSSWDSTVKSSKNKLG